MVDSSHSMAAAALNANRLNPNGIMKQRTIHGNQQRGRARERCEAAPIHSDA